VPRVVIGGRCVSKLDTSHLRELGEIANITYKG
jgi:hypothetical protein